MSPSDLTAAIDNIRAHAEGTPDANGDVLADVLWRRKQGEARQDLEPIWVAMLECLQGASSILRERFVAGNTDIPLPLSYAVAEVLSAVLRAAETDQDNAIVVDLRTLAWWISCAWEGLLAGDIDDLAEHVRLESMASGIRTWSA